MFSWLAVSALVVALTGASPVAPEARATSCACGYKDETGALWASIVLSIQLALEPCNNTFYLTTRERPFWQTSP